MSEKIVKLLIDQVLRNPALMKPVLKYLVAGFQKYAEKTSNEIDNAIALALAEVVNGL